MENCPFNIVPYAQSTDIARPNIVNLNYTNQDFWSLKSRLIDYTKQNFSDDFSDFIESSLALMLIENWAFIGDTICFKIDQVAGEQYIDTVTEIDNAFRLSLPVGFEPQPPISGRCMFLATINNPILTDLEIITPFETSIQSEGRSVTIELFPADSENKPLFDQNITIPAGNINNSSIVGIEGKTYSQEIVGNGQIGQTIQLSFFPVIWDSIRVDIDGVRWEEVKYFTDSQPRREYRVEYDSSYNAYVIFGNSKAGFLPSNGSRIVITYRVGGGTAGNIVSGYINTQTIVTVPGLDFTVPVSFRNYTKGEYGYNGDTIEDIRKKLPLYIKTQDRAVTGLDYKTLADQFSTPYNGQVGKATAVLRNHGCAGNIIDIYLLARNGLNNLQLASNQLKKELLDELEDKKMFTDFVCIKDGAIIQVDITIDLVLNKFYRKFEEEIKEKVNRKVNLFFNLVNWDYGKHLKENDLIKQLSDIKEVSRFDINFTTNDENNSGNLIVTKFYEIIRPDTINITFSYE